MLKKYTDQGRCRITEGNFLESVPAGGDMYILKRVLSHYSDEEAGILLANIRNSMADNGRVLVIDPGTDTLYGASFNVLMLVAVGGGGLCTEEELQALFAACGFSYTQYISLSTELCIVEAVAV